MRARNPGLNPNDVGYLQRADQQHAELWIQRREDQPGPLHRYYHVAGTVWLDKTFGPEVTGLGAMFIGYWQLPDHSATYLGVRRNLGRFVQTLTPISPLEGHSASGPTMHHFHLPSQQPMRNLSVPPTSPAGITELAFYPQRPTLPTEEAIEKPV